MADFTIRKVERLAATEPVIALALGGVPVGGSKAGVAATIETDHDGKTLTMGVSKLEGETEWVVDSLAPSGGFPFYANGVGSRCTALKVLSDAVMIAALDGAAADVAVAA